jgi:CheY-like chemotaxis protein
VKTTCDILTIKGYEAIAAYSGEQGIAMVTSEQPNCVLMDIKMPGIDGVETMKRMQAVMPDLPVVLVSAYVTDETIRAAKAAGAYAVLGKPLNFQLILSFLALMRKEESILVVDDDPEFCRTMKDILLMRGYRVQTEADPGHVLGDMENDYQLAVILDLKLGAVDGTDVLEEVRNKYPTKPVVLVTGYKEEMAKSIEKGLEIGAYTCLYKPLEIDPLLHLIEEIRTNKLQHMLDSI